MFKVLMKKYPCLWDPTNEEFRNITYKSLCRKLLLKEINLTAVPPYSMARLKINIQSHNRWLRKKKTPIRIPSDHIKHKSSSPVGESNDGIDDGNSIDERDVTPDRTTDDGEATVPEGSSRRRHKGYSCDVCRKDIVGYRYACVQCANCDLCGACEARGEHATHYVLRVPPNKLDSDVRAVIQKIRDQLWDIEDSIKNEFEMENDSELELDPLEKTYDDEPPQDTSYQDIHYEKSKESLAVKYEEPNQPNFTVESHQPDVLPHQAKAQSDQPKIQSHQPKVKSHQPKVQSYPLITQCQDPPVTTQKKRPLKLEGWETESALAGEVVVKVEAVAAEGGAARGRYAVYTHRADGDGGGGGVPPAEPSSSSEKSSSSRKKRKNSGVGF